MNDLRISYIDQLKGIAILLVVLGHVIGYTFRIENFGWNEVSSFMIKKFRTLLLPMVTWGIVIPFFFLRSTVENNFIDYLSNYITMWGGGLWFFATLFFLSALFLFYRWILS